MPSQANYTAELRVTDGDRTVINVFARWEMLDSDDPQPPTRIALSEAMHQKMVEIMGSRVRKVMAT